MMTVADTCDRPMEVSSKAARLSLDEREFIESSLGADRSVADVAQPLGRDRSTVHREVARCADRAGYDARWAHAAACARARRERTPKLAVDRVLAAAVAERLRLRDLVPDMVQPQRAGRCQGEAGARAHRLDLGHKRVIDLQRLYKPSFGPAHNRPCRGDRFDDIGPLQPPRAALSSRARRRDLTGVEPRRCQRGRHVRAPLR